MGDKWRTSTQNKDLIQTVAITEQHSAVSTLELRKIYFFQARSLLTWMTRCFSSLWPSLPSLTAIRLSLTALEKRARSKILFVALSLELILFFSVFVNYDVNFLCLDIFIFFRWHLMFCASCHYSQIQNDNSLMKYFQNSYIKYKMQNREKDLVPLAFWQFKMMVQVTTQEQWKCPEDGKTKNGRIWGRKNCKIRHISITVTL